ncbi:MAG: nitrogenase component 1 [Clostridiales Family XIII bacterium]|jgi:nitrogenase molybdenum-iron protein alpha/beta subunit|nr:nitrogenase component 1 [Clostridiales Family XIII bacterium]
MGLYKFKPLPSGRMGTLWTLCPVRGAVLLEYGCMGHMNYAARAISKAGINACKLYSTHIDETDIALGGIDRIRAATARIARQDRPRVIFFLPSSLPEMIGTDLPAITKELQPDFSGTKLIPFGAGNFKASTAKGVAEALLTLVKTLPVDLARTQVPSYNIIGSCADIFSYEADAAEAVRIMRGAFGMSAVCVLTSDTSVTQIEKLGSAHVNLVIRREGEAAAKHLAERFGTPYVLARPYGTDQTVSWIERTGELAGLSPDRGFIDNELRAARRAVSSATSKNLPKLTLGGHVDVVDGIRGYAESELSLGIGALWCDSPEFATADIPYFAEDDWARTVAERKNELIMASGDALRAAGRDLRMQIANPSADVLLTPGEHPFIGFRGAANLANLWSGASRR